MKKKILTLLIIGGLLLGTSGIGMAYASTRQISTGDMQKNQVQNENVEKHQGTDETNTNRQYHSEDGLKQNRGRHAISAYSKFSGMTEDEIKGYMTDNDCNLKELAAEKGNLEDFMETLQEEE
jgi:hypothetical protein